MQEFFTDFLLKKIAILFLFGIWIYVLLRAFFHDIHEGFYSLIIPFYISYFVLRESKRLYHDSFFIQLWAVIAAGITGYAVYISLRNVLITLF